MHFVESRDYGAGGALPLRVSALSDAAPFLFRHVSFAVFRLSYCENHRAPYLRGAALSAAQSVRKHGQPICCYCCRASVGARSARSACVPQYKSRTCGGREVPPRRPGGYSWRIGCEGWRCAPPNPRASADNVAAATKAAKLRKMRVLSNARVMRALSKTACFAQLCDPARRQPRAIRSKGGAHVRCSSDSRNAAASSAAGRVVRHPRAATAGAAER